MSRILSVAWRDFKHTVFTKAFIFAVFGFPILFGGIGLIAAVIFANVEKPPLVGTIAVVDPTDEMAPAIASAFDPARLREERDAEVREAMEKAGELTGPVQGLDESRTSSLPGKFGSIDVHITIEPHPAGTDPDVLKRRIRSGDLIAAAILDEALLAAPADDEEAPRFRVLIAEHMDNDHTSLIERTIGQAIVRARLAHAGQDPELMLAMLDRPRPRTSRLLAQGETDESAESREFQMLIPMAFMMLIWIATFSTGQHLLMSTIEEKSNKVMEVLLSAVSPLQLLTGKIIGQGLAGLIIVAVYASVGIAGLVAASSMHMIDPIQLVYLGVYFLMAYLMVASVMAAVGSAVTDVREANSLMTPVMIVMMFPLILWLPISQAPNGAVATALSFIPPAIPFVMILRATADESVAFWQIPVTIVWGFLCVAGMIWLGSRIFRVGVLMQGKPPSPIQLLKWIGQG